MEGTDSPVSFFEWLKRRRKALDLTQDELAARAGCSVGALRKIESGERRPSKQLAKLLARALEISDQDLPIFMRVARGELNLERLHDPGSTPLPPLPEVAILRQPVQSPPPREETKPTRLASRIPVQATPLIGRETELAAMDRLFHNPQCRLLTLTGIGGIGKTRLAIEFASGKMAQFPGGVFFIPLASVNSPEKIVPVIADVLDFGFSGPADPQEQLFNYISSFNQQEVLFVFDNLEHLLAPMPDTDGRSGVDGLIAEILERLPIVKILATSRERLNLYGEWAYELHGLPVPPQDLVGHLEDYDSIALFVRSAQRVKVNFQILADERFCLMQICQLLEGVPLAIELAASWVSLLSCQDIAQEIKSSMDFLTTSMRDVPERHRSIRATFDHSWKLLTEEERLALCQLSVFHGGFDRTAALQVAGASLPLLASLCDKSLVRRTESGRYDLHEVIRQYALVHLNDLPDNSQTYQRHCYYYFQIIQSHENWLKNTRQQEAIRTLTSEIDNIRAAWAWAIDLKKYAQLEQAGRGFGWYFEITGLYLEGIEQLERLVEALKSEPRESQRPRLMGLLLIHQALLHFRRGEFNRASRLYEESILVLRPVGDQILLADALVFLGSILHNFGEHERSRALEQEGLMIARQSDQPWLEAWAVFNLGYIDGLLGRVAQGYEQMQFGLNIWRALGDPHAIALGLNFQVPTLNQMGRLEEAKASMQESIALCELSKNRWGMATAYRHLGLAYLASSECTQARAYLQKSLEMFGQFAQGWDIARSLTYLGDAALIDGDFQEARKYYQNALQCASGENLIPIALDALLGMAELLAHAGERLSALVLCYFILEHASSEAGTKLRAEQLRVNVESGLDPKRVAPAKAKAQEHTLDWFVKENLSG